MNCSNGMTPYSQALELLSRGRSATGTVAELEDEGVSADDARVAVRAAWSRLKPGPILIIPRARTREHHALPAAAAFQGLLLTFTTLLAVFAAAMAIEAAGKLTGAKLLVVEMGLPLELATSAEIAAGLVHLAVAGGLALLLNRDPKCRPVLFVVLALLTMQGVFEAAAFEVPTAHLFALPLFAYVVLSKQLSSLLDR